MPKRTDIHKILVIGSGPIVIGQACEFDYSGTQACKALREEGLRGRAGELESGHDHDRPGDRRPHLHRADHAGGRRERSSRSERPDALLPTLGGQTALNITVALGRSTAFSTTIAWSSSAQRSKRSAKRKTASSSSRRWSRSAWMCRAAASPAVWTKRAQSSPRSVSR